ncbi:respiratory nitrate reductase subunit gamma [Streptomyces asoensis]|uniref:respiratory nitrate reductase subunit gamma n=1 Tax=Streptomyces asoensis TaxID=249586 RepID=UPI003F4CD3FB
MPPGVRGHGRWSPDAPSGQGARRAPCAHGRPVPPCMTGAPVLFRLHVISALPLFAAWPFTRLVHMLTAPLGYLTRPYIVYRSRDGRLGTRPPRRGRERTGHEAPPHRAPPYGLRRGRGLSVAAGRLRAVTYARRRRRGPGGPSTRPSSLPSRRAR